MIFNAILLILLAVIVYFYWVQGLFTGVLSAIAGMIAGVLAVSYHENLVNLLFTTRLTDSGVAISLVMIFAITFVVLRLLFDALIPGNIRLPAIVDKVGGAVAGLILGIFATGVFAIAAQSMPFGPSIGYYTRFKTQAERAVVIPSFGSGQDKDSYVYDEVMPEDLNDADADRQSLLLPVDQWVLGFVSYLSDGGSLAGDRTFSSVHPNYLDELFGQRIGIQPAAQHVAVNAGSEQQVSAALAYLPASLNEGDSELAKIRGAKLRTLKTPPRLVADEKNVILVIRVMFKLNASDSDKLVRFSTGSIHLVANGKDYFPIGTIDGSGGLLLNKPDDPIFVDVSDADHGADVVFVVPRDPSAGIVQASTAAPAKAGGKEVAAAAAEFAPGAFLEVKRLGRVPLKDVKIVPTQSPDASTKVLRKKGIVSPNGASAAPAAAPGSPRTDAGESTPFLFEQATVSSTLPLHSVAVGLYGGDPGQATFPSGTAEIRGKKIARLAVNPVIPLATLGDGDNAFTELFVPQGMKAVQLSGAVPPKTDDPWMWAEHLGEFAVTDANGKPFRPSGAVARVIKTQQPMMVAAYDATGTVSSIPRAVDARPTDVWLLFVLPDGTAMKELDYQGRRLTPLNKSV